LYIRTSKYYYIFSGNLFNLLSYRNLWSTCNYEVSIFKWIDEYWNFDRSTLRFVREACIVDLSWQFFAYVKKIFFYNEKKTQCEIDVSVLFFFTRKKLTWFSALSFFPPKFSKTVWPTQNLCWILLFKIAVQIKCFLAFLHNTFYILLLHTSLSFFLQQKVKLFRSLKFYLSFSKCTQFFVTN